MAYGIDQVILHPDMEVVAGPWVAKLHHLHYAGWKFDVSLPEDYGRVTRVFARNPVSGVVSVCTINTTYLRQRVSARQLYFPEQTVMTNEFGVYKEITVPTLTEMVHAEVGVMIRDQPSVEFRTYDAYNKEESQEIIVTPEKIPMLLDEIRKAQEPGARDLLRKQTRDRELVKFEQKATILTFPKEA